MALQNRRGFASMVHQAKPTDVEGLWQEQLVCLDRLGNHERHALFNPAHQK